MIGKGMVPRLMLAMGLLIFGLTTVQVQAEDNQDILARVGKRIIKKADFEKMAAKKEEPLDRQTKVSLLNNLVQTMALSDAARAKGLDKRKEIKEIMELTIDNLLANELLKEDVISKIKVSDEEAKKYYEKNIDQFKTPEKARIRHILILISKTASPEDKKKAAMRAEEALQKIKAGEDFAKVVQEYSDDTASKEKGGELGFISRGRAPKDLDDAVFRLNPGEVSPAIETSSGYEIVKMEEKRREVVPPFENIKGRVIEIALSEAKKEKIKEMVEQVMKKADVKVFENML